MIVVEPRTGNKWPKELKEEKSEMNVFVYHRGLVTTYRVAMPWVKHSAKRLDNSRLLRALKPPAKRLRAKNEESSGTLVQRNDKRTRR